MTVGAGLAAAGSVALIGALFTATIPVWAAVGGAAVLGLVIGGLLDAAGVGEGLKRRVNEGLRAWPGIFSNLATVAQVVGESATEAATGAVQQASSHISQAASSLSNAATELSHGINQTVETAQQNIETTVQSAASAIQDTAANFVAGAGRVADSVVDAAQEAAGRARSFIGSLFGGGK